MQEQHRSDEEIQADIDAAEVEHTEAAGVLNTIREKWEGFKDELMHARTAKFDPELVQKAAEWGLNPHNFHTEEELMAGIEKAQAERTQTNQGAVLAEGEQNDTDLRST